MAKRKKLWGLLGLLGLLGFAGAAWAKGDDDDVTPGGGGGDDPGTGWDPDIGPPPPGSPTGGRTHPGGDDLPESGLIPDVIWIAGSTEAYVIPALVIARSVAAEYGRPGAWGFIGWGTLQEALGEPHAKKRLLVFGNNASGVGSFTQFPPMTIGDINHAVRELAAEMWG